MSRGPQNEIPDISDPKPSRNVKISACEAEIPTYETEYANLNIHPMENPIIYSNLPHVVMDDPMSVFKHFLRESDYVEFAQNTNINASVFNARETSKSTPKRKGRSWKETNAAEMKVYVGILLYMGVHPIGSVKRVAYWNTSRGSPRHPAVQEAMGCTRFYQLCRYFKASNLFDEVSLDMHAQDWWKKVNPLVTNFRNRSREALIPGRDVAIDELLIEAKGRSKHTLQIPSKAAGKGYKVYALCTLGYLYDFVFTSRTEKIAEVGEVKNERQTSTMV
jgi:hypothetical protein